MNRYSPEELRDEVVRLLREGDMTIDQLTKKIHIPKNEVVYWVMSLMKYGHIQTGEIDDMDEYFSYKLKK